MQTTTFVTQYEGPKKVHLLVEYPLIGILSSLGSEITPEQSELVLNHIRQDIQTLNKDFGIFDIKKVINTHASEHDVAIMYLKENCVYFVTSGTGIIFVRRGGQVRQIVADGLVAKGNTKENDEYIATTSEYLDFVGGMDGFTYYFGRYKSSEVSEMMETYEDQSSPSGFVAVHIGEVAEDDDNTDIQATTTTLNNANNTAAEIVIQDRIHVEDEPDGELVEEVLSQDKVVKNANINNIFLKLKNTLTRAKLHKVRMVLGKIGRTINALKSLEPKKLIAVLIAFFVLILILKSIPYGDIFKNRDQEFEKLKVKVDTYLEQAETLAFEDMTEVSIVLQKARDEIEVLSDADKKHFASRLKEISSEIDEKEKLLLKISESKLKEYYSLSLVGKDVTVTDVDSDGNNIYILDSANGAYYSIPIGKISQEIIRSDKMKNAIQISAYEGRVYVLTKSGGIYRIEKTKSTQLIKPDSSWGKIVDMKLYASNIYLLDGERGDIYKYPGISENEFGTQVPYLVEEMRGTLKNARQIVITGPVYVVGKTQIAKYIAGRREDFILRIPYKDGEISLFTTTPDNRSYYVFDSTYNALYSYSEDIIMDRQFKDSAAKNTKNIIATEDGLYVVTNASILNTPKE